jgi:hypothetical protein
VGIFLEDEMTNQLSLGLFDTPAERVAELQKLGIILAENVPAVASQAREILLTVDSAYAGAAQGYPVDITGVLTNAEKEMRSLLQSAFPNVARKKLIDWRILAIIIGTGAFLFGSGIIAWRGTRGRR